MCRSFLPRGSRLPFAALAAVVVGLTFAAPGRASVTATFSTVNPGEVVTITSNGVSETGWAGQYDFVNASGDLHGSFGGFCIDIGQNIYGNQTVTFGEADLKNAPIPGAGMGATRANLIRELWARDYGVALLSNSNAAAFQIAIWEIINEQNLSQLDVTKGSFTVSDSDGQTLTTANAWLAQLTGTGPRDNSLVALTSADYQDYVVSMPAPPGLALAAAAGACGACAAILRRRRLGGSLAG
jgi:hypothetical protein